MVSDGDTQVLIDTSPDLREQLLAAEVTRLDAVILSHAHADHLHGIDDIRGINRRMNAAVDLWAQEYVLQTVKDRFPYVLTPLRGGATTYYKPTLTAKQFEPFRPFRVGRLEFLPITQDHGFSTSFGFRMGDTAYTTDFVRLDDRAFETLRGVGTWIIGTFSWDSHPTHLHVDGALALRDKVKPKRMILTHLSSAIDFKTVEDYVPEGVSAAYDGLEIDC